MRWHWVTERRRRRRRRRRKRRRRRRRKRRRRNRGSGEKRPISEIGLESSEKRKVPRWPRHRVSIYRLVYARRLVQRASRLYLNLPAIAAICFTPEDRFGANGSINFAASKVGTCQDKRCVKLARGVEKSSLVERSLSSFPLWERIKSEKEMRETRERERERERERNEKIKEEERRLAADCRGSFTSL